MAKLRDYRAPTRLVALSDGDNYEVRGLSLADLMHAFEAHRDGMELLFAGFADGKLAEENVPEAIMQAIQSAPALVALLLATALGEADEEGVILSMPLDDQIVLAESVLDVTLRGGLVIKKVQEMAAKWGANAPPQVTKSR